MKKTLIAFALMISGSAMGQTNYNTIMNPNKVKREKINLCLTKAKNFENASNTLRTATIATALGAVILQYKKPNNGLFLIPIGASVGWFLTNALSGHYEEKAKKMKRNLN